MRPYRLLLYILLIVFIVFGTGAFLGLHHMEAVPCPFMNMMALCQMNPLDALSRLAALFNVIPAILIVLHVIPATPVMVLMLVFMAFQKYRVIPIHHLLIAFSDGILHPKIYA